MRTLIVVALLALMNAAFADVPGLSATQNPNALYRLFSTQNTFNLLLLNTMDGSIRRLQWSQQGNTFTSTFPKCPGAAQSTHAGRYTLQSTQNIWTFILLDQDNGSAWYVQWSVNGDNDFCLPVPSIESMMNPGASDNIPNNTPPKKP
jgi:hypothetical protein